PTTTTSYSFGIRLSLQRRQGHERGRALRLVRVGWALRGEVRRFEPRHARAQLSMFVAQLPVRLGQPLEPLGHPAHLQERRGGEKERDAGQKPVQGQQTSYLIERLATVSTA